MDSFPLVSILLVSMNHEKYIEQCITSVMGQTYVNLEILYLDNNSADDSFEKAFALLRSDSRCKLAIKNTTSLSYPQNLNIMLQKATGKYICNLSTDDWLDVQNTEEKVNFLESSPFYAMVYGSGILYYEDTGQYKSYPIKVPKSSDMFQQLLDYNLVFPIGALIKRSVFEKIGYYDETLRYEDWEMWIRIAQHYPIGFQNKELVYYRRHSESFCVKLHATILEDVKKIIKKYRPYNKYPLRVWTYYIKLILSPVRDKLIEKVKSLANINKGDVLKPYV
jgi:glycosyltransferase involved in cell wall biosynthesis